MESNRFMFIFSDETTNLLRSLPKRKMTDAVEKAIKSYFGGNRMQIEADVKAKRERLEMDQIDLELSERKLDEVIAREEIEIKAILKRSKVKTLDVTERELDERYPLLSDCGIHRTNREVIRILEGMR